MDNYLRVRLGSVGQDPVECEPDIDVYVSMPGGDEDTVEPQIQVKFTEEGMIIDTFLGGVSIGTSSETYDEIHERLSTQGACILTPENISAEDDCTTHDHEPPANPAYGEPYYGSH